MELLFSVILAWVATISVFLLGIIYILRKIGRKNREGQLYRLNKSLRKYHKWMGMVAIGSGLLHGFYSSFKILSFNQGTYAWIMIILLGVGYMFRKKLKGRWAKSHRVMAAAVWILVIMHVVEVGGFVGVDGLAYALEREGYIQTETTALASNENAGANTIRSTLTDSDEVANEEAQVQSITDSEVKEDSSAFEATQDTDVSDLSDDTGSSEVDQALADEVIGSVNESITWDGLVLADGTYTGVADGYGPNLTTSIVVEGGKVVSVEVVSHNEKREQFWGTPVAVIPGLIAEEETADVDAITGATYTSYGIMMSVQNALEDAIISGTQEVIVMPAITSGRGRH